MPTAPELIWYLIVIVWMFVVLGFIWSVDAASKKFHGMMARRSARRILLSASPSEILAARCRVLDARRDRTE